MIHNFSRKVPNAPYMAYEYVTFSTRMTGEAYFVFVNAISKRVVEGNVESHIAKRTYRAGSFPEMYATLTRLENKFVRNGFSIRNDG